jgi:hypothetical protein
MASNYRLACGYLTVDGRDVGDVLIAENLAHRLRSVLVPHAEALVPAPNRPQHSAGAVPWTRGRRLLVPMAP